MDHYIQIKVLPDLETTAPVLMNNLFAKLHRRLGQKGRGRVGVSFPKTKKTLGDTIRIHGSSHDLDAVMDENWLKGLRDYTHCSEIIPVPEQIDGYRTVKRVQVKSVHNKRKRSIAKGWLSEEEAHHAIPDSKQERLKLPFLQIHSLSNKNTMRIFVEHGNLVDNAIDGTFNSYGLSSTTTVPWF